MYTDERLGEEGEEGEDPLPAQQQGLRRPSGWRLTEVAVRVCILKSWESGPMWGGATTMEHDSGGGITQGGPCRALFHGHPMTATRAVKHGMYRPLSKFPCLLPLRLENQVGCQED